MNSLWISTHLKEKVNEIFKLDLDFNFNVKQLKECIGRTIKEPRDELELIYLGSTLDDELTLTALIRPDGMVHCFRKTKQYAKYIPKPNINNEHVVKRVQELFNVIAHIQINVNSRVNILQKIVAEFPEFRRNLGAQALIRDSVLFNTLHKEDVCRQIAANYPIIVEAAQFIVETVKKELTRYTGGGGSTDSTNSSEEENSLGASGSSSSERASGSATAAATGASGSSDAQRESARIRQISRQQLQTALRQIGFGSVNSLSNIAQRNSALDGSETTPSPTTETAAAAGLANSASGERISSALLRSGLQSALDAMNQPQTRRNVEPMDMDTAEPQGDGDGNDDVVAQPAHAADADAERADDAAEDDGDSLPPLYRSHRYAEQLRLMAQMGFVNYTLNATYLTVADGNIDIAVNLLMADAN